MKYINKGMKTGLLLTIVAMVILSSCNKKVEQFYDPAPVVSTAPSLAATIAAIPNDSLYYKLIIRGGLLNMISLKPNAKDTVFTMFVPDNPAMRSFINLISGGATIGYTDAQYVGFINTAISASTAYSIVSYNMIPQFIRMASVPSTFPNWFYPTNLNPTSGAGFNPLVRLTTSPSTRNGNWVNNVPLTSVDLVAYNGIIHTAAAVPAPPSVPLWSRIATDPDLTYLKAAVQRADSGVSTTTSASLEWALTNFGPNLTVFAPSNLAFQNLIFGLVYAQVFAATGNAALATLIANGAVAAGPAFLGTANLTTQQVKGIVVYHLLGSRAFTNNFPTTITYYPTLLNGGIPTHPGIGLTATFTAGQVSAATVKGVGNATASNIAINPFPNPFGTSDQHFINGSLHKINQVLLPQ